jgi:hypothetical protein
MQTTAIDQTAGIVNLTTVLAHSSGEWLLSNRLGLRPSIGHLGAERIRQVPELIARILGEPADAGIPAIARTAMVPLITQIEELTSRVQQLERRLLAWHKTNEASQRLATIPGVGLITATALAASDRSAALQIRTSVCCLARFDATAELFRGKIGSAPYPRWEIAICEPCSSLERPASFAMHAPTQHSGRLGSIGCWRQSRRVLPRWRWPTRRRQTPLREWAYTRALQISDQRFAEPAQMI